MIRSAAVTMAAAGQDGRSVSACIIGDCEVRLWGLTSHERLRRLLARAGVTRFIEEGLLRAASGSVVCIRADYLYDERIIRDLVATSELILETDDDGRCPVAAHVPSGLAPAAARRLLGQATGDELNQMQVKTPHTLSGAYAQDLRKFDVPVVLAIRPERRAALARHLFDGAYKGVTDAITKWVWPAPARWVTAACTRLRIRPNHVTLLSLLLVAAATVLFASAHYASGLAVAWVMTFLDTVDGKLARVTVDSTRIGGALDHGLDLVHPPFWYVAWGMGLPVLYPPIADLGLNTVLGVIVVGYIVGRLIEGAFTLLLGAFGIFCWRPVDSYFRLIVARRNPNLVLLSVAALLRRPEWGLLAVAIWTAASTAFLALRLLMSLYARATSGPLRSWLAEPQPTGGRVSRVARPFVRYGEARNRIVG